MTTKEVLLALQAGASLHMEFCDGEMSFWLDTPCRAIRQDVGLRVIEQAKPENDSLFSDTLPQTWVAP